MPGEVLCSMAVSSRILVATFAAAGLAADAALESVGVKTPALRQVEPSSDVLSSKRDDCRAAGSNRCG